MWKNVAQILVAGVLLLVFVCTYWVNSQANKHVNEANAALDTANALVAEIAPKYKELLSDANLNAFPDNRNDLKGDAQAVAEQFKKASEQYRLSASKLEEASKQGVKKPLSDYWNLKAQSYRKLADSKETFGKLVELLLDESIPDFEALNAKMTPIVELASKANDESHALDADAKKIQEANKDVIK